MRLSPADVFCDFGDLCGECPIWSPSRQTLYWSDITGRRLYRYSFPTHSSEVLLEGFEVSGIALHAFGGLILANSTGLWMWDEGQDPVLLLDRVEGDSCPFNDCIADPSGRVFAGTSYFGSGNSGYKLGSLIRVDLDGSATVVDDGVHLANGLGFSPDCSTLYFTDSALRLIYAYNFRAADGRLSNRRVFVSIPADQGIPDGLTVDAEGFVWSAQWFGGCVVRYDPSGREERRIAMPASQVSSLAFGGEGLNDMFVTSASAPDALSLAPPRVDPSLHRCGGPLYRLRATCRGLPEHEARLQASTATLVSLPDES